MYKLNPLEIKKKIMKIGLETGCSHVASAMSCVNLLCDLYNNRPEDSIIILSKGHGALAQYVILNKLGRMPTKVLNTYYKDGGLSVHSTLMPEYGVYASTGSLGHGLAIGIGYAIANPLKEVWVIMGDGELDEGSVHEALRIIKKLKIKNIFPVVDVNFLQGYSSGDVELPEGCRQYYSIKGEDWGDKIADKVVSHYTSVTPEVYKEWLSHCGQTEKKRLQKIREYKLMKSKEKQDGK
jgi:transketolase N-terminal domain/subunit